MAKPLESNPPSILVSKALLRIRIEQMRMRIQEKIPMRMRIHALAEL
jgi:hypothetical protein